LNLVKHEMARAVEREAKEAAAEQLLDLLVPQSDAADAHHATAEEAQDSHVTTRDKLREMLGAGQLDEREVEVQVERRSGGSVDVFSPQGIEHMGFDFAALFDKIGGGKKRVA